MPRTANIPNTIEKIKLFVSLFLRVIICFEAFKQSLIAFWYLILIGLCNKICSIFFSLCYRLIFNGIIFVYSGLFKNYEKLLDFQKWFFCVINRYLKIGSVVAYLKKICPKIFLEVLCIIQYLPCLAKGKS